MAGWFRLADEEKRVTLPTPRGATLAELRDGANVVVEWLTGKQEVQPSAEVNRAEVPTAEVPRSEGVEVEGVEEGVLAKRGEERVTRADLDTASESEASEDVSRSESEEEEEEE